MLVGRHTHKDSKLKTILKLHLQSNLTKGSELVQSINRNFPIQYFDDVPYFPLLKKKKTTQNTFFSDKIEI